MSPIRLGVAEGEDVDEPRGVFALLPDFVSQCSGLLRAHVRDKLPDRREAPLQRLGPDLIAGELPNLVSFSRFCHVLPPLSLLVLDRFRPPEGNGDHGVARGSGKKGFSVLGNLGQEGSNALVRSSSTAQLSPDRRRTTFAVSSNTPRGAPAAFGSSGQ